MRDDVERDLFERDLESGLRLLAERAPAAPPDLMARVRARRSRRWWRALAAILATGAIAGTGAVVTSAGREPIDRPEPIPSIEKAHPRAVHSAPLLLPDGRPYDVVAMIDRSHALIRTTRDGHADHADGLWSLDLPTGGATLLVGLTAPKGTVISSWSVAVGAGKIAWWTGRKERGEFVTTFFTAPVTGGRQRVLTEVPGSPLDFAIAGGKVVWTRDETGGAYEVPLEGGRPRPIGGAEGLHLLQWPWVGDPITGYREILNVRTGERRTARGWDAPAKCSVTWCATPDRVGRRDGTSVRHMKDVHFRDGLPALDRFLMPYIWSSNRFLLYDLVTGRSFDLASDDNPVLDHRMTVLAYEKGGRRMILDLAAIP
ncbi:hypothetical protein [Herbidospora sp. RD11066]